MFVFFFKQKTAYEMLRSLVGSEMCIRDRRHAAASLSAFASTRFVSTSMRPWDSASAMNWSGSVSYTHLTLPTIYSV